MQYSENMSTRSHSMRQTCMQTRVRYTVVSPYMVRFYCFVTEACATWSTAELAGATRLRQARPSSACTFSDANLPNMQTSRSPQPQMTQTTTNIHSNTHGTQMLYVPVQPCPHSAGQLCLARGCQQFQKLAIRQSMPRTHKQCQCVPVIKSHTRNQ